MNENIVVLSLKLTEVAEEKRTKVKNVRIKMKKEYLSELESAGLIVNSARTLGENGFNV